MINAKHLMKTVAAFVSSFYSIYYWGLMISAIARVPKGANFNVGYYTYAMIINFVLGLVMWNVICVFGAWLFATLFNSIKEY